MPAFPHVDVAKTCGATTVNTTSTALLAANPSRLELTIVNLDATNPVYLVLATSTTTLPTATVNGLKLAPGASYSTTSFAGAIAAIATTAACQVHVTEL
jgi:hypothetical protein